MVFAFPWTLFFNCCLHSLNLFFGGETELCLSLGSVLWCGESISLVNIIFLCLFCHLFLYWIVFYFISVVLFLMILFLKCVSPNSIILVLWNGISLALSPSMYYVYHEISIFIFLGGMSLEDFYFPSCSCGCVCYLFLQKYAQHLSFCLSCFLPSTFEEVLVFNFYMISEIFATRYKSLHLACGVLVSTHVY